MLKGLLRQSLCKKWQTIVRYSTDNQAAAVKPSDLSWRGVQKEHGTKMGRNTSNIYGLITKLEETSFRRGRVEISHVFRIYTLLQKSDGLPEQESLILLRSLGSKLKSLSPSARREMFNKVLARLKEKSWNETISLRNAILRIKLENEDYFDPAEVLKELENDLKLVPNRVTYQLLIASYCERGNLSGALKVLEFMKNNQFEVNERIMNSFIRGNFVKKDTEGAWSTFEKMKNLSIEPSALSYHTLMQGFAELGDYLSVGKVLLNAKEADSAVVPSILFDTAVTFSKAGHSEYMEKVLDEHLDKNGQFAHSLMNSTQQLIVAGKYDDAITVVGYLASGTSVHQKSKGEILLSQMLQAKVDYDTLHRCSQTLEDKGLLGTDPCSLLELMKFHPCNDYSLGLIQYLHGKGLAVPPNVFVVAFGKCQETNDLAAFRKIFQIVDEVLSLESAAVRALCWSCAVKPLAYRKKMSDSHIERFLTDDVGLRKKLVEEFKLCLLLHRHKLEEAIQMLAGEVSFQASTQSLRVELSQSGNTKDPRLLAKFLSSCHAMYNNFSGVCTSLFTFQLRGFSSMEAGVELCQIYADQKLLVEREALPRMAEMAAEKPDYDAALWERATGQLCFDERSYGKSWSGENFGNSEIEELESLLERKPNLYSVKKSLLIKYCTSGSLAKVASFEQQLRDEGFEFGPDVIHHLAVHQLKHAKDLETTRKYIDAMRQSFPSFDMTSLILDLSLFLIREQKDFSGAVEVLKKYAGEHPDLMQKYKDSYQLDKSCDELLSAAGELFGGEQVQELHRLLGKTGFMNKRSFRFIRQVALNHLRLNQFELAIDLTDEFLPLYGYSSWISTMLEKLIVAEDGDMLQKAVDRMTGHIKEQHVLLYLMACFINCGKPKQAGKILATPGLRAANEVLEAIMRDYWKSNKLEEMRQLASLTENLFACDRNMLLLNLLRFECRALEDGKKEQAVLRVYARYEEEGVRPRANTLLYMAKVLESVGAEVPFEIPEPQAKDDVSDDSTAGKLIQAIQASDDDNPNTETILTLLRELYSDPSSVDKTLTTSLFLRLMKRGRHSEARQWIHFLAAEGMVEQIDFIISKTTSPVLLNYIRNRHFEAHINAGSVDEVLDKMRSNPRLIVPYSSTRGVYSLMKKHPEKMPFYDDLLETARDEIKSHFPYHHRLAAALLAGDVARADSLTAADPQLGARLQLRPPSALAESLADERALRNVVEFAARYQPDNLQLPYGNLLLLKSKADDPEGIVSVYREILSAGIQHERIWSVALQKAGNVLKKHGVALPWASQDGESDSDGSSGSDEDNRPERK